MIIGLEQDRDDAVPQAAVVVEGRNLRQKFARIGFPIWFLIFNVIYAAVYFSLAAVDTSRCSKL